MIGQMIRALSSSKEERAASFDQYMASTHRQAYAVAYRLTGNVVEAEDLMQETFLRAYRFFHRYDPSMPFSGWLFRIMTNLHIDQVRKKKRFRMVSLESDPNGDYEARQVADPNARADQAVLSESLEEPLQLALQSTNADFRMAVILADIEGLSYEEIAEIMETSVGTVRSRIHRGRKQVKDYLERNFPGRFSNEFEGAITQ